MSTVTQSALKPDLSNWDPENEETWDSRLAWRTLWITTYSLTLGFATWYLVSAIAPRLNEHRVRPRRRAAVLARRDPRARRRAPAASSTCSCRRSWARGRSSGGARSLLALPMLGWTLAVRDTSTPYSDAARAGLRGRHRRRHLLGLHALDELLLPQRRMAGHRARAAGRHRQLRHRPHPAARAVGRRASACSARRRSTRRARRTARAIWLHNGGLVLIPWVVLGVDPRRSSSSARTRHGELPRAARHLPAEAHLVHDGRST